MAQPETLEKGLVLAGLEALREVGGDALVGVVLGLTPGMELGQSADSDRLPLDEYLRYRDAALELLQESFSGTAFETGRLLVKGLKRRNPEKLQALISQFKHAANKLPLIGQAAVLAARGNPGSVRAALKSDSLLAITIENCPECRNLRRSTPFCSLNQGVITEFAESYLGLTVETRETRCLAVGDPLCEIEVTLARPHSVEP